MSSKKNKKIQKPKKMVKKSAVKKVAAKKIVQKKQKQVKKEIKKVKKVAQKKPVKTINKKVDKKVAPKTQVKEKKPIAKKETAKTSIEVKAAAPLSKLFRAGDYAVYPSHGVGKIADFQTMTVLGKEFSCYLMFFEKEKLTIKIPADSISKVGLRPLATKAQMDEVFSILRSGVKKLKGMWSRRAQEYETKINSGDIILLAEVLRDLTRDIEDGERSYSERIIYETAIARLASEYAAIYNIDFEEAKEKVITTAKDKLGSEPKMQKDEFDEFDYEDKDSDSDDEESDEDEEEELDSDDEDEDYYDEDEDERPAKRARR